MIKQDPTMEVMSRDMKEQPRGENNIVLQSPLQGESMATPTTFWNLFFGFFLRQAQFDVDQVIAFRGIIF